jgi:hypothetical protein
MTLSASRMFFHGQNVLPIHHCVSPSTSSPSWRISEYTVDSSEQQSLLDHIIHPRDSISENWILRYFICFYKFCITCVHVPEIFKTQCFDSELLQQYTLPAQSINHFVSSTQNMFNHQHEILHILYPFCMLLIQLLLLSHKLQCMIVTIQNKFLRDQVILPIL